MLKDENIHPLNATYNVLVFVRENTLRDEEKQNSTNSTSNYTLGVDSTEKYFINSITAFYNGQYIHNVVRDKVSQSLEVSIESIST